MRAVLAFCPVVSPTYVPLSLATLVPYIRREAPACELSVVDLNLALWETHALRSEATRELMDFLRGQRGDFFDATVYAGYQRIWAALGAELEEIAQRARRYLEGQAELPAAVEQLGARCLERDPERVGLSVTFPGQLILSLAVARHIKQTSGAQVVMGGAALTAVDAKELLVAVPEVDGVVLGEGEPAVGPLFRGEPLEGIPGLFTRAGQSALHHRAHGAPSLEGLPDADFGALPLDRYFNPSPVLPVLPSRGCDWHRCRFCVHNLSYAGFRALSGARVAAALANYHERHGARHFYFADQYVGPLRLAELVAHLEERQLELSFHALGRPVAGYLSGDLLDRCYAAGCHWISWGVESGSQRLLDLIRKGTQAATAEQVLLASYRAGISNLLMLIFGLPSSTDDDLDQTLGFIERVYGSIDALTASAFVLFAKTDFARHATRHGLQVLGAQDLLPEGPHPLHTIRLTWKERATDQTLRPSRGQLEVDAWERRRAWLGELSPLDSLCTEHYLLYAGHRARARRSPIRPDAGT